MSLNKTINQDASSFGWDTKPLSRVLCNAHKRTQKRETGSPKCSWSDWLHFASQHIVNNYMVLCKRSRYHNSNEVPHTLQENTER